MNGNQLSNMALIFRNNIFSNISSERRFLVGLKIWPATLNILSTAADAGSEVLRRRKILVKTGYLRIEFGSVD